jgi:ATP/maltotriose-dependent transcriptional regulator MalT
MWKETRRTWNDMAIPLVMMTRFFQLVSQRKFAEAERVLERITVKMKKRKKREFNRGYLEALSGIILTHRSSGESYEFFSNIDLNDVKAQKKHQKDFKEDAKSRFHADYDRGYFSALADYMRIVIKTARSNAKTEAENA